MDHLLQARPNVSSSLRLSKRTPSAPSKQDAASTGEQKVNVEDGSAVEQSNKVNIEHPCDDNRDSASAHLPSENGEYFYFIYIEFKIVAGNAVLLFVVVMIMPYFNGFLSFKFSF